MKKSLVLVLALFFSFTVIAQENSNSVEKPESNLHEISFKIGMVPYVETVVGALACIGTDGNIYHLPSVSAQYLYYVDSSVGLGGALTFGSPVCCIGPESLAFFYTALQVKLRVLYLNKEKIKLYGDLGAGGELLFANNNDFMAPFFSASISPLGIWFGSDKFFGTTEICFGSEGIILNAGCGFRI